MLGFEPGAEKLEIVVEAFCRISGYVAREFLLESSFIVATLESIVA